MASRGFLAELRRRNVLRMAGLYLVGAWLVVQVASTLLPAFGGPGWMLRTVIVVLAIGFVPALVFSWVFEWTPAGLKRDAEVPLSESIAPQTARRLDRLIIVFLALALAYFAFDKFVLAPRRAAETVVAQRVAMRGGAEVVSKSIAVLPFKNLSGNPQSDAFVDGMHDDLLTQLAKIGALKVISRTSVEEYRDTKKNLRQIAAELGVANILEGGVQRAGSRVRINAQLIDAQTDQHLWAETYDRELNANTLFELQSDIARSIAGALRAQLLPGESASIDRRLTSDLDAWLAYRTALQLLNRAFAGDLDAATTQVDFALERDPGFAAAWALRSRIAIARYWFEDPSPANLEASREALDRGLALEPDSPELRLAEGYYHYWGHRDYARALAATDAALRSIPNDADLHLLRGFILRRKGDWQASILAQQRALEFDPRNALGHNELALTFLKLGDIARAEPHVESALQLEPMWGYVRMAKAILLLERDRALDAASEQMEIPDVGNSEPALWRWWLLVARGRYEQALVHADFGRYGEDRNGLWPPALMRGMTLRHAGRDREAEVALQQAHAEILARLRSTPDFHPATGALCLALGAMRRRDDAQATCARLLKTAPPDAMAIGETRYIAASGLALAGAQDRALPIIEATLSQPNYAGAARFESDPAFAGMREDPRFIALMQRFRNRSAVQESGSTSGTAP